MEEIKKDWQPGILNIVRWYMLLPAPLIKLKPSKNFQLFNWFSLIICSMTEPQPSYSAYREASFGHGILDIRNRTHAYFGWNCNQDAYAVEADSVWLHNRYWTSTQEHSSIAASWWHGHLFDLQSSVFPIKYGLWLTVYGLRFTVASGIPPAPLHLVIRRYVYSMD